ncbi:DUF4012 domain-containing protein [Rathayibacter soli]|uniref:DUF4012 domain-containing protein n=1 Tax=Rathayibacter soli TaxID=3144168 RepID=UPI0027E43121|nr:DUF4012 domain-containing protein [Glaciibacter superstes]
MPHAAETRRSTRHNRRPRKRLIARWWFWAIIVVVLVVVAVGAWVGVRGLQAKKDLEAAIPLASTVKSQLLAKNVAGAQRTLESLRPKVADAKRLTGDFVWRAAELVPVVGSNLTAMRKLADATDLVVNGAVQPLLTVGDLLDPATFKPVNGAINIAPLSKAVPAFKQADAALQTAVAEAKSIDTGTTIGQVTAAKVKFVALLDQIAPTVNTLNTILPLLPRALGADGARHYVVVFQNTAEMRALGGTVLSSTLATVDNGKISMSQTVPAGEYVHYGQSVIPVPDGVEQLYPGAFGTFIANATVRPSFESTAQITKVMWKDQFGVNVDGVISIDPTALSYVMRALGPVPIASGDVLTSGNLVPLLLNQVYLRYPKDGAAQDAIYAESVDAVFARLSGGQVDPKALLAAATQGWKEHRLLFWSADASEQKQLVAADLSGPLPVSDARTDRVGVYFQDAVGSKLDFYLKQSVTLAQGQCRSDGKENYRVTVTMTNTAPANAADTLGRSILGNYERESVPAGVIKLHLMLYAPPGSTVSAVSVGGASVPVTPYHDTTYPVSMITTQFAPGASQTVTFDVVAGTPGARTLAAQVTPLISPTQITTAKLDCSTVQGK